MTQGQGALAFTDFRAEASRREMSRGRCVRLRSRSSSDQAQADPTAQRLRWALAALGAYERGLTAHAAIRRADAEVNGAAAVRQELLALLSCVGERDSGRSLASSLRQLAIAQAAGALRSILPGLGRILRHLRPGNR